LADEYGDIHIVKAGPEYEHKATNKLHESCLASPAISGNLLLVRTIGHLFAIGKGGETKGIQTRVEKEEPEEKIDFSAVKMDGSIQNPQELIKLVSAKLQTISSVEYDISVKGAEAEESTFGVLYAKAKLLGYASGIPEYFHIEGSHKEAEKESSSSFIGGSDGNEYYYVDKDNNTIKKGVEYSDAGADFRKLSFGLVTDFVSDDPLSTEKTAEKMGIDGIKEINGEDCYELHFAFPQYGNYEIIWYFSVKNFLPQARTIKYTMRDGKRGGYMQTITNIKINKHSKPNIFKIKDIKKYQIL
jgi:hypothetical protein